ncbi:DUF397 domain-containing protein [Nocardiopsis mangrovi]|uniref:DUF397 domain-containing protein n=1 Tax=Nocardiopsis mangrovi TaxID=1179818 RepID=A0ABV9DPX9_9ACTN
MQRSTALRFRKSSYSAGASECVEVADGPAFSAVRDTQNRHLGHLEFSGVEWAAFIDGVKAGEL